MKAKLVKVLVIILVVLAVLNLLKLAFMNWEFIAIGIVVIGAPVLYWILSGNSKRNKMFRERGWTVIYRDGKEIYKELTDEGPRGMAIKSTNDRGEVYIYVPTAEQWPTAVPYWAIERREEIVAKYKEENPPTDRRFYLDAKPEDLLEKVEQAI